MKRILALILAVMLVLSMSACGGGDVQKQPEQTKAPAMQQTEPQKPQETEAPETTAAPVENWGVPDSFSAFNNDYIATIGIRMPTLTGIPKGSGLVAYQEDGSLVVVDSQKLTTEVSPASVDDVLPDYFVQTKSIFNLYRNSAFDNFEFEVTSKEHTSINGYEMCKFVGVHTFSFDGNTETMNFVAYATQLKINSAYVYWMVLDETADQSLGDTIADHAYNMALSLSEG